MPRRRLNLVGMSALFGCAIGVIWLFLEGWHLISIPKYFSLARDVAAFANTHERLPANWTEFFDRPRASGHPFSQSAQNAIQGEISLAWAMPVADLRNATEPILRVRGQPTFSATLSEFLICRLNDPKKSKQQRR